IYAADALGKLGADAKGAVPELLQALYDQDLEVRRSAASALGKLGRSRRDEAFDGLLRAVKDPEREGRLAAARALFSRGEPAPADAPALRLMLADRSPEAREGRVYAAWGVGQLGADFVPVLVDTTGTDPDGGVSATAAEQLGLLKVKSREVIQALTKALGHHDKEVRMAAATALSRLGVEDVTLPGLLKALDSKDVEC